MSFEKIPPSIPQEHEDSFEASKGSHEVNPDGIEDLEEETKALCDEAESLTAQLNSKTLVDQLAVKYEQGGQLAGKLSELHQSWKGVEERFTFLLLGSMGSVGLANMITMSSDTDSIKRNGAAFALAIAINSAGLALNYLYHRIKENSAEGEKDSLDDEISDLQRVITKNKFATK